MDLCDFCAVDLQQLLRAGKISALEILDSYLARIEQVDGCPGSLEAAEPDVKEADKVHAFITLDGERARQQATNVDKKLAAGEDPGILAGVPFTVKDIFCVENTRTTAASRILANFISPYSATSVARMEAAGGLNLGKVNLDEFVFGSSSESSAFQPCTRNPWSLDRVAGGSSGGSAASVAAGEALVSLGTDTAGSIRQPAAFCGVVGLKPTYGRVSRYGVIAFGSSLDCPGAIGKSVRDTALAYQCMAGTDVHDVTTVTLKVEEDLLLSLDKDMRGLRIGLSPDYFRITFPYPETGEYEEKPIPQEIKEKITSAAKVFSDLGAEIIEDVPLPNTCYGIPAFFVISRVEAASNLHRYDGVKYGYRTPNNYSGLTDLYRKTRGEGFGYQPKLRILMGMYVSAAQYSEQYYQRALRVRTLIRRDFDQIFDPHGAYHLDALLTPTTPTTAFKLGAVYGDSVMMQYADQLTVAANHAGVPAISIPAGLDSEGLPVGIQLIGNDFSEALLLRIARCYEKATSDAPWRKEKPQVLRV